MAASFVLPAGPAARPAGRDLAERAVAPGLLVFGRRAAAGAPHHPRGVVPAGPFAGGRLDPGGALPRPQVVDDLGLVQTDDRLGQRVVIGVPDGPDRRRDARFGQLGAVPDRQVLAAGVAVVDQPGHLDALAGPAGDRHHQRVQHQVRAVVRRGAPPGDQPGERVDDQRGIRGARPGGHEGEVHHLQPVRRVRREATVDQVAGRSCDGSGTVVRGFFHPPRRTPRSPSWRISRSTVHRAAAMPSRLSWSHTFQAP